MADPEMSLRAFTESNWFRGLFRGAVIAWTLVIAPAVGYIAWTLSDVWARQDQNAAEIVAVQATLAVRAADSERFQAEVRGELRETGEQLATVVKQVGDIAVDAAMTRGIVEEMRRQAVAKAAITPMASDGSIVWVAPQR